LIDTRDIVADEMLCKGATQYQGQILFAAEGQGPDKAPALIVMNPVEPYNNTSKSAVLKH
jgi:hypothetical protein